MGSINPFLGDDPAQIAFERELELLKEQKIGDLINAAPTHWRIQIEDMLTEITEALIEKRRQDGFDDLAAERELSALEY